MGTIIKGTYVWMNGKFVPSQEAKIPIFAHIIHYGTGTFEGIPVYLCADGRFAIFRLDDHINRHFKSSRTIGIEIPYTESEVKQAIIDTVVKNNNLQEDHYIRPLVYVDEGDMGPLFHNNPIGLAIMTWEWEPYFGKDASKNGVSVKISIWRRDNKVMPYNAKVTGNYVNAGLAKREAEKAGFKDAIIRDTLGNVAEGSATNIFIVKNGELLTPNIHQPILRGITRDSLICLVREIMDVAVKDNDTISVDSLYDADEAFFCGTAGEITPIKDVEEFPIGPVCPGPITKNLQELYSKLVRGKMPDFHPEWLTYI